MTWELRKIGSSGRLCLLLVLAVLCSGVLFALHATADSGGYTVSGLRQAMAQKDLPGYEERLWQELEQAAYTGTRSEYDALRRELDARDIRECRAAAAADILGAEIDRYRAGGPYAGEFPERWLPAGLAIVDEPFTEQNGLINSTMKIVRNKVEEYFRDRIDYLYTPEGRELRNDKNLASLRKMVE